MFRPCCLCIAALALLEVGSAEEPNIVVFTTQQDHQEMMRQLGITKLRPGPSGNPPKIGGARA